MTQPRVRHFRLCMEHQVLGTSHRDIRSPVVFSGHIMVSSRPNSLTHTDTRVHGTADVEAQFRIAEYAFLAYVSRSLVHQHMLGKYCVLFWKTHPSHLQARRASAIYGKHDFESSIRDFFWKCHPGKPTPLLVILPPSFMYYFCVWG